MQRGRPSSFDATKAVQICERLASGETLAAICRDEGMPNRSTVHDWILRPPAEGKDFPVAYARAREIGIHALVDQTLEIAADGSKDVIVDADGNERTNNEVVQRSRLRVDTIKWLASKIAPKVYGERLELAGDKDAPLTITVKRLDK